MSLLNPAYDDPLSDQLILLPLSIDVNDKSKYYVEDILDSRIRYNRLEYLVNNSNITNRTENMLKILINFRS